MKRQNRGIDLSHHCVVRFLERSRPALDVLRAREELEILVGVGDVTEQPPGWFAAGTASSSDAYLIVGDDLVIPLTRPSEDDAPMVATTCIVRGMPSEATRARWNARKARRRVARARRRR